MAALNMGSMNYAIYSETKKTFYHDHVFANSFKDIQFFLETMRNAGVRPEMECFDAGHIGMPARSSTWACSNLRFSSASSWCPRWHPRHDAAPGRPGRLAAAGLPLAGDRHRAQPVAAGGGGDHDGGNVRVGLEDNFYVEDGKMAKSNGDLVERRAAWSATLAGRSRRAPKPGLNWVSMPRRDRPRRAPELPHDVSSRRCPQLCLDIGHEEAPERDGAGRGVASRPS